MRSVYYADTQSGYLRLNIVRKLSVASQSFGRISRGVLVLWTLSISPYPQRPINTLLGGIQRTLFRKMSWLLVTLT